MFKLTVVFETKADAETAQRFVLDSIKTSGNVMRTAQTVTLEDVMPVEPEPPASH